MTALCTIIKSWIEGTITLSYITRIKEGLLRISCQHIESIQKLDQIQIGTGKFCLNNALEVKETMSWSCRVRKLKWHTRGHCCYLSWGLAIWLQWFTLWSPPSQPEENQRTFPESQRAGNVSGSWGPRGSRGQSWAKGGRSSPAAPNKGRAGRGLGGGWATGVKTRFLTGTPMMHLKSIACSWVDGVFAYLFLFHWREPTIEILWINLFPASAAEFSLSPQCSACHLLHCP